MCRSILTASFCYEVASTGPAGVAYSNNTGLKLGAEENIVLKEGWQFTGDDSLIEEFELQVLTATGQDKRVGRQGELHELFSKHKLTIRW